MRERIYAVQVIAAIVTCAKCISLGSSAVSKVPIVDFAEVYARYDAFLLDQFGVVHDGKMCYAGSAECVRHLQKAGKRVVVLSNSSKRRQDTIERLHRLKCGVCTDLNVDDITAGVPAISVFTSGDLVHTALSVLQRADAAWGDVEAAMKMVENALVARRNRAFVFGNGDDDYEYLETAGLTASDVETADFLLARGLFCTIGSKARNLEFSSPDACDDILEAAAAMQLPMIVANPDLARPDGRNSPMPGILANRYADGFGGRCIMIGKPHASIYDKALEALASVGITDKKHIAAVGDSMHHDVEGGLRCGVDTFLVAGGIHADEFGVPQGKHVRPSAERLDDFLTNFPTEAWPTAVIPGFTLASH